MQNFTADNRRILNIQLKIHSWNDFKARVSAPSHLCITVISTQDIPMDLNKSLYDEITLNIP